MRKQTIYIPIWLDLLYLLRILINHFIPNLHSNMVRFIIFTRRSSSPFQLPFTFQYGQIYYFNFLFYSMSTIEYLHSNMVRFIIGSDWDNKKSKEEFTFQYGQIYYRLFGRQLFAFLFIYIPIWLDLLLKALRQYGQRRKNLHSNMVRFIIYSYFYLFLVFLHIYIPIWLDLL